MQEVSLSELVGKILSDVAVNADMDEIVFRTNDGAVYCMYHLQDCCEEVYIEDICGELDWLIGTPILVAEERTSEGNCKDEYDESCTWTFYTISTIKGTVVIRWYGTSNGYYSESVSFVRIT